MYYLEDTEANKEEIEEGPMINKIVFFTNKFSTVDYYQTASVHPLYTLVLSTEYVI